ncbi:hypothetical protein QOZ80_1BG0051990 [Eleusine coracana subsp. coracana]|nr:hypothetical protein QOZ80_1BG0051990 [Eleusine coracana subsp. coracana]
MTHGSFQTTLTEDAPALEFKDPHSTGAMFNDDEQPIAAASNEGRPAVGFNDGGRVLVKANHSKAAPLEATTVRVQLEVSSSSSGRAPLDLVVVLDVSGSMCEGGKLDQFKSTIDFVVARLSPMDRLSIVTFSDVAKKVSPLHVMSKLGKFYIMGIVDGLVASASGDANIKVGLETAQEVLAGRQYMDGRAGHIILLMSDGHQNAMQMSNNPCNFPIHTCVVGANTTSSTILQLASGLLKAAVEDLHLILSKPKSRGHDLDRIVKVASDNNSRQETNRRSGTVTIKFGDLLGGQVRKADAELLLFKADGRDYEADILDVSVSYPNSQGTRQAFKVQTLRIKRSDACHHPGAADDLITTL